MSLDRSWSSDGPEFVVVFRYVMQQSRLDFPSGLKRRTDNYFEHRRPSYRDLSCLTFKIYHLFDKIQIDYARLTGMNVWIYKLNK